MNADTEKELKKLKVLNNEVADLSTIEVVRVVVRRGGGVDSDPIRFVEQFWTRDGRLVGEIDHHLIAWAQKMRGQLPKLGTLRASGDASPMEIIVQDDELRVFVERMVRIGEHGDMTGFGEPRSDEYERG